VDTKRPEVKEFVSNLNSDMLKQVKAAYSSPAMPDILKQINAAYQLPTTMSDMLKQVKAAYYSPAMSEAIRAVCVIGDFGKAINIPGLSFNAETNQIFFKERGFGIENIQADLLGVTEQISSELDIFSAIERIEYNIENLKIAGSKKEPFYKDLLKQIFYWFIFTICFGPFVEKYWMSRFPMNKQEIVKQVQKSYVVQNYDSHELAQLRIVTEEIRVRAFKSKHARVIRRLYLGQVVRILRKDRKWVEVEFIDSEGNTQKGWLFNRYLKKISQ
jgi:hypothetical protein